MKKRFVAVVATSVAVVGSLLGTTSPAFARDDGLHHLMVYKPDGINSVYINTTNPSGAPFTACRPLSPGTGWVDGNQDLVDGRQVNLITFTSSTCTFGYSISRTFTVPTGDGLENFWANMA
jgi:hypothetical protein